MKTRKPNRRPMEIYEPSKEELLETIEADWRREIVNKRQTKNIAEYIVSYERIDELLDKFIDEGGLAFRGISRAVSATV